MIKERNNKLKNNNLFNFCKIIPLPSKPPPSASIQCAKQQLWAMPCDKQVPLDSYKSFENRMRLRSIDRKFNSNKKTALLSAK